MNEIVKSTPDGEYRLTVEQAEALEKMGARSMERVSEELGKLLRRDVEISAPQVMVDTASEVLEKYQIPFVIVKYAYKCDVDSPAYLLLKEPDALQIAALLGQGGEESQELTQAHMNVVGEVSNLMVGASSMAISEYLGRPVDYDEPVANLIDLEVGAGDVMNVDETVVILNFILDIDEMPKSSLLLLLPFNAATEYAALLDAADKVEVPEMPDPVTAPRADETPSRQERVQAQPKAITHQPNPGKVNVSPVQYPAFEEQSYVSSGEERSLNLVYDIPLAVTVELGKTKKNISEILELGVGSIFTLDKMAGEPVEILANGKLIAKGDVVVIDENYGVRITDIVNGEK